jgi:hypothetical protein
LHLIQEVKKYGILRKIKYEVLTPELLELRRIDSMNLWVSKWNGVMPQTIMGDSGVIPTFSLGGKATA